jgi:hypothetical protein
VTRLGFRLHRASAQHKGALVDFAEDYRTAGEDRYDAALADLDADFCWLAAMERAETCPPGLVPQTTYWAMDDDLQVLAASLPNLAIERRSSGSLESSSDRWSPNWDGSPVRARMTGVAATRNASFTCSAESGRDQ